MPAAKPTAPTSSAGPEQSQRSGQEKNTIADFHSHSQGSESGHKSTRAPANPTRMGVMTANGTSRSRSAGVDQDGARQHSDRKHK